MFDKKWIELNDLSSNQYSVNKNVKFKTPMLRSDLCDYKDAYIAVTGIIDSLAATAIEDATAEKDVLFKSDTPLRSCIWKINRTLIFNTEDFQIAMPIYDLLEYTQHYSTTSGSLRNYHRDKIYDADGNAWDSKSLSYKTKIVGNTPERTWNEGDASQPPVPTLNVEVTFPLKCLSDFWGSLDLPLINHKIELDLS